MRLAYAESRSAQLGFADNSRRIMIILSIDWRVCRASRRNSIIKRTTIKYAEWSDKNANIIPLVIPIDLFHVKRDLIGAHLRRFFVVSPANAAVAHTRYTVYTVKCLSKVRNPNVMQQKKRRTTLTREVVYYFSCNVVSSHRFFFFFNFLVSRSVSVPTA